MRTTPQQIDSRLAFALTVVPESVFRFSAQHLSVKVLLVALPRWRSPVGIITLKHRCVMPTAKVFIATAHQVAKALRS